MTQPQQETRSVEKSSSAHRVDVRVKSRKRERLDSLRDLLYASLQQIYGCSDLTLPHSLTRMVAFLCPGKFAHALLASIDTLALTLYNA